MKDIVLIDGNSLMYRAYFAMPPLTTLDGEPTGAVYGFTNMLLSLRERFPGASFVAAFDVKGKTFRHELFDEYKGTRKPMEPELISQMVLVKDLLRSFRVGVAELPGYEADDIIGTLAYKATQNGQQAHIVTGDKDALQLVMHGVNVYITNKGVSNVDLYDKAAVEAKLGVQVHQVIDLKALMGDKSDNIPGVKGIGEKRAQSLLSAYDNIEELLRAAKEEKLTPAKMNALIVQEQDIMQLSKTLATIDLNAPIGLNDIDFGGAFNMDEVQSQLKRLNFGSLNKKLFGASVIASETKIPIVEGKEFNFEGIRLELEQFNIGGSVREFLEKLKEGSPSHGAIFDLVFDKNKGFQNGSIGWNQTLYTIDTEADFLLLRSYFENADYPKRAYDSKALHLFCYERGIDLCGVVTDVSLGLYLLQPSKDNYDIDVVCAEYCPGIGMASYAQEGGDLTYEAYTASKRMSVIAALADEVENTLEKTGLLNLYSEVEIPLAKVLASIEHVGFKVDLDELDRQAHSTAALIEELEGKIYEDAGQTFNINSTRQLSFVLFEVLGLKGGKKTKTGYSTDREVLNKLVGQHPIIQKIIDYRTYSKLKSTYLDGLKQLAVNGRVHTSLNQTIAVTGRLSSTEPNLQNIPIRIEEGRNIRKIFVADDNSVLLSADYSQIELRVLAHLSEDPVLIDAFHHDMDIHRLTASEVFKINPEDVTSLQRSRAKEVNFGIVYGMGDFGLSESLGIPMYEAKHYISEYFRTYRGVKQYMDEVVEECKQKGYVTTVLGRRRQIPEMRAKNKVVQAHGIRMARNTTIQGSAADIIKIAMIKVFEAIRAQGLKSKILLQIHDELILNVPTDELELAKRLLRDSMEQAYQLRVPLKVDMSTSRSWYDAK